MTGKLTFCLVAAIIFTATGGAYAHAASIKIAPLSYEASLRKDEVKKGYIDISNPLNTSQEVSLSVQAFRQIDDKGSLEFYDSEYLRAGIRLDLEELLLGPGEAYRVYFLLDGTRLPQGDVFGGIFATTKPDGSVGAVRNVRVGTLIILQNGAPAHHQAVIDGIFAPWLQVGEDIEASMKVKNIAAGGETGFAPDITVAIQPYTSITMKGPLIFAGRTRDVMYRQPGSYFGPVRLRAAVDGGEQTRWVFAVTGYWRWLAPVLGIILLVSVVYAWFAKRGKS